MDRFQFERIFDQEPLNRLFEKFYPRAYQSPTGYPSMKSVAKALCWPTIQSLRDDNEVSFDDVMTRGFMTTARLLQHDIPTFYVESSLVTALLATDPPLDTPLDSLRWPFDGILFILKEGSQVSPSDGDCPYLAIAKHKQFDALCLEGFSDAPKVTAPKDCFTFLTSPLQPSATITMFSAMESPERTPTFADLMKNSFSGQVFGDSAGSTVLPGDDELFLKRAMDLGLRLLLTMLARPDLITHGERFPQDEKLKRKGAKEVWRPNFIGRSFQPKSEIPSIDPALVAAERFGPRCHWRRGHYRSQPCGPRLSLRKIIWIEPILVGTPE